MCYRMLQMLAALTWTLPFAIAPMAIIARMEDRILFLNFPQARRGPTSLTSQP